MQWAARSLPTRPSVPILAGLLVRADAAGVVLSSFDYETSAKITVQADVADEGEALVSGRLLADICRSLPAKPVDLTADGTHVELVCGSARFTLQTLPVADYPTLAGVARGDRKRAERPLRPRGGAGRGRRRSGRTAPGVHRRTGGDRGRDRVAAGHGPLSDGVREFTWNPATPQTSAVALVPAKCSPTPQEVDDRGEQVILSLASSGAGDGIIGFEGHGGGGDRRIPPGCWTENSPRSGTS